MPSLRQKVTTYFRQLSFIAEPRDGQRSPRKSDADDDGNFITKYLEGRMQRIFAPGPEIYSGQNPTDLPALKIGHYATGPNTITAACTGPDEGLTGIKRSKLHLSASYADDIDFIDTMQESDCYEVRHSMNTSNSKLSGGGAHNRSGKFNRSITPRKLSAANLNSSGSDQNSAAAAGGGGMRSRKNSRTSISNLNASNQNGIGGGGVASTAKHSANNKSKAEESNCNNNNNNKSTTIVVSMVSTKLSGSSDTSGNDQNNQNLLNSTKTDTNEATTKATTTTKAINASATHSQREVVAASKVPPENTTERLLREAVSSQAAISEDFKRELIIAPETDAVASVTDWKMDSEYAYGISVSLYENNMVTKEPMGNPIADCYGIVVHGDAAILALADGVNWGDGARLAARSAVHGCLDYLDRAIFGMAQECMATTTQEVFVGLLRSLWEGHGCILEVGGALSTLTIAVVLPLASLSVSDEDDNDDDDDDQLETSDKYVVCACNVGDSLGYVYSKQHGVREFTQASHDITSMRDMRDALGALGPADGNKPELSNLTISMTIIDKGDIVFLTSDGISDNFDPVVGKFAEAWTPDVKFLSSNSSRGQHRGGGILAPKRQNKSASAIHAQRNQRAAESSQQQQQQQSMPSAPVRPPRSKKSASPENVPPHGGGNVSNAPSRPKYMRSQTVIEPRRISSAGNASMIRHPGHAVSHVIPKIPRSISGLPLVTGPQRHALTLYRLEDLLSYGINGTFSPCVSARRLCHLLIDFVRMITSARRKTLEQRELFYKLAIGADGARHEVELNRMQHRAQRKRIVDSSAFVALPGKLDHATVVAYTVGGSSAASNDQTTQCGGGGGGNTTASTALQSKEFQETNF